MRRARGPHTHGLRAAPERTCLTARHPLCMLLGHGPQSSGCSMTQVPLPVRGQRVNHLEGAPQYLTTKLGLLCALSAFRCREASVWQEVLSNMHCSMADVCVKTGGLACGLPTPMQELGSLQDAGENTCHHKTPLQATPLRH